MLDLKSADALFAEHFDAAFARTGRPALHHVRSHSRHAATAAREIATAMRQNGITTIDPDEAYVAALLHDIGKTVGDEWPGLEHALTGYHLLTNLGEKLQSAQNLNGNPLSIPARIALTHTWYGHPSIDRTTMWQRLSPDHAKFVQDYLATHPTTELERLVQLIDNMSYHSGIMSISDRFGDILLRHNLADAGSHLHALYALKSHFDQQCGRNIYELFADDIARHAVTPPASLGRE